MPVQVHRADGSSSNVVDKGKYPAQREYERAGGAWKERRWTNPILCERNVLLLVDLQVSHSQRAVFMQ
jgi:hypothetical protein